MTVLPPEELPRQTYKRACDQVAEDEIAARFAAWAKAQQLKIGTDQVDRQKPRIDRVLYRGTTVVVFFEIKSRSMHFRSSERWITGRAKIDTCRRLQAIVRVPVIMVVAFGCGTLAWLDTAENYTHVADFGRSDRGDPADREPGAAFDWSQFKVIDWPTVNP